MTTPAATPRSSTPIRIGLVGIGNWALHGHVRVLKLLPQYELTAIYAQRADAARRAAVTLGIAHVVDSLEDLAGHPEVDLVVVLTTAPQHERAVRAAIAAKKNVYCEWPLSTSVSTSEELLRLAEESGVKTVVGLQRRFAPHNRYLSDLLRDGFVGRLRSVRMHVSMNYFQAMRSQALRWTVPEENFSSVVAIYGGHFMDMLLAATGWPVSMVAVAANQFKQVTIVETGEVLPATTPDQLMLVGELEGGAVLSVHIEGGKRNGSGVQIDITGDEGDIRIVNRSAFGDVGDDYRITGAHGDDQPMRDLEVPASYQRLPRSALPSAVLELAELYTTYADDLRLGLEHAATFKDAVRMHRLIADALAFSKSGVRVEVAATTD